MQAVQNEFMKLVADMNEAFGNKRGNSNKIDWADVHNQCKNLESEYRELVVALEDARDPTHNGCCNDTDKSIGVRDALCDLMVFILGAYHKMGIDPSGDMRAVINGVMTRFVKNEADLAATLDKWEQLGIKDVVIHGKFPRAYIKAKIDQVSTEGEFIPKGKFLKSASYRNTIFPEI